VAQISAFDGPAVEQALRRSQAEAVIDELTALPKNPSEMAAAAPGDRKLRLEGGRNLYLAARSNGVRRYLQQASGFFLKPGSGLADESERLAVEASPTRLCIRAQDLPLGIDFGDADGGVLICGSQVLFFLPADPFFGPQPFGNVDREAAGVNEFSVAEASAGGASRTLLSRLEPQGRLSRPGCLWAPYVKARHGRRHRPTLSAKLRATFG
jgi:hypothetical protein